MPPRSFSLIAGILLLALAIAELSAGRMSVTLVIFVPWLVAVHVVGGLVGTISAAVSSRFTRLIVQLLGAVAFAIALLGFIPWHGQTIAGVLLGTPLPMLETVIHLLIGVTGIFVGFGRDRE